MQGIEFLFLASFFYFKHLIFGHLTFNTKFITFVHN